MMTNDTRSGVTLDVQISGWRLAIAALEAERARVLEKYDRRLAALRYALKAHEQTPEPEATVPADVDKPPAAAEPLAPPSPSSVTRSKRRHPRK
jgi:hypothetical protein